MERALAASVLLAAAFTASAQVGTDPSWKAWNEPVRAFAISENISYIGAAEVSSFLIATPEGYIVIDTGFKETVPRLQENLKALGVDPRKVKYLLSGHAHGDHVGGHADFKKLTGATIVATAADAELMARGGKRDPMFGDSITFDPVKADRIIKDGDTVELGGVKLTAVLTPGHTKGCTTWTMTSRIEGKDYPVVFACSISAPGYKLVGNAAYPDVVSDFRATFERLGKLDCQVFLTAHGSMFALDEKRKRVESGDKKAFVDPEGCKRYVTTNRAKFEALLLR